MTDPYVVLGVSRTASDEEIKKKYRELARKYHPDNYANNPLADLAQEKMKQINEAYDAITKERAGGGAQYKTYTQPGSTSSGSASGPYRDVRSAIMAGDLARAEMILGSIVDRNAEWYFLMGAVAAPFASTLSVHGISVWQEAGPATFAAGSASRSTSAAARIASALASGVISRCFAGSATRVRPPQMLLSLKIS